MAGSTYRTVDMRRYDRLWWLPAHGVGNGIDDSGWVPILEIRGERLALSLLALFLDERIPGYAAPVRLRPLSSRAVDQEMRWRLWVGAKARGSAEDLLLRVLPDMVRRYGERALG